VALEATIDPEKDNDGDGYLFKDDCNDGNPEVNPGAYEVPGDGVDNDCNGKIDDVPDCDNVVDLAHYKTTNPMDFARALGLCQEAKADAEGKDKRWGVIKAELVRVDGSPLDTASNIQFGILKNFGKNVLPRAGKNLVVLSSGTARTPDYPGFKKPRTEHFTTTSSLTPPAGHPKPNPACLEDPLKQANDSVNLKMTIRVPTNAKAFLYDFDFYSSEYSTFICSRYNDSFVALLDSKVPLDPKYSKNISFDAKGNPVNVNSGFFEVCTPGTYKGHVFPCAKGTTELQGTGFWDEATDAFPDPKQNGATSWLETKAPVAPGETIVVQFMIWDTGDHILDSTVLLDNWRWDAKGTTAPITDRPK
jgi:Putative metal-binding motif